MTRLNETKNVEFNIGKTPETVIICLLDISRGERET